MKAIYTKVNLLLASSSKYRQKILRDAGFQFEIKTVPDIVEEEAKRGAPSSATEQSLYLATVKAKWIVANMQGLDQPVIVIAADQVVLSNGSVLGKPQSKQEAKNMLRNHRKYPPSCVSSVAVINTANGRSASGTAVAVVEFRDLPDRVVNDYLNTGEPQQCSGGFSAEHHLLRPHVVIHGSMDCVEGLPLCLMRQLIEEVGGLVYDHILFPGR